MNTLRRIHLYLGCAFAPLLVFFAISGIWQTLHLTWKEGNFALALLSTIHMSRGLKAPPGHAVTNLSSPYLQWVVVAMAISLVMTIVLGVVMAFRFGHRRPALLCLALGVLVPLGLVLSRLMA